MAPAYVFSWKLKDIIEWLSFDCFVKHRSQIKFLMNQTSILGQLEWIHFWKIQAKLAKTIKPRIYWQKLAYSFRTIFSFFEVIHGHNFKAIFIKMFSQPFSVLFSFFTGFHCFSSLSSFVCLFLSTTFLSYWCFDKRGCNGMNIFVSVLLDKRLFFYSP